MKKNKFQYFLIPGICVFLLTACGMSNATGGRSAADTTEQTSVGAAKETGSETPGQMTAQETTKQNTAKQNTTNRNKAPEIAKGYQFVRGLGICAPGSPVIYQMSDLNTPEVKNEYGTAQLLSAFYQDGKVRVSVLFKDYSAYRLSEDEVREIRETEKENQEKQERVESVDWDDSYFYMDAQNQIYGRSRFLESLQRENDHSSERQEPYGGRMRIKGSENPGYRFNRRTTSYYPYMESSESSENGYMPILVNLVKEESFPPTSGPEGVHELQLNWFEEPFTFEFRKAPELSSLRELPGIVQKDGVSFYTEAEKTDEDMVISFYIYSEDQYQIIPDNMTVFGLSTEGDREMIAPDPDFLWSGSDGSEIFTGIIGNGYTKQGYVVSEKTDPEKMIAAYDGFSVSNPSTVGTCTIPIPESEKDLDIQMEFPGGILHLTKVSRMQEKMERGTDKNGETILKPAVYLTAFVEDRTEDGHVYMILVNDAKKEKEEDLPYLLDIFYSDTDNSADRYSGSIEGFKICYEEGQKEIELRFHHPYSWWNTAITVPVTQNYSVFEK